MFFCKTNTRNLEALKDILRRYEQASGQCINAQKSAVTFSRKAQVDLKEKVKRELRIEIEGGVGKYLGLPEHFGRRKKDLFASIVDRIKQKAISWANKFLSTAGKMTLLKSVLTAIPTYAMSCFKLPISLCKKIQSTLTRFWWDRKQDERKMAWVSWHALTQKKADGGLGFREIQGFNEALLAKISWRILENPNGLLAKVLLSKYCQNQDFMSCEFAGSMSHGWRSILVGRDLLRENLGWAIGDGHQIKIWQDKWLGLTTKQPPIGPPRADEANLKVSDLIKPNGSGWNQKAIREIFPHYEEQILRLQLSKRGAKDKRIWLKHFSGVYSVKSGYQAKHMHSADNQTVHRMDGWNWNSEVWNLATMPKIKLFLWKAFKGALPTKERLLQRHITTNPACIRCGESESISHILFQCCFAKQVWRKLPFTTATELEESRDLKAAWRMMKGKVCLPPMGIPVPIAPWVCWSLWTARNNKEYNNRSYTVEETVDKAMNSAREWINAQSKEIHTVSNQRSLNPHISSGIPTCRIDGAWRCDGTAGLGWTLTSNQSTTTERFKEGRRFVSSALSAEAIAMREALISALSKGYLHLAVESDSSQLIQAINTKSRISELHGILFDIEDLKSHFETICFKHIRRALNVEADGLAKDALNALVV